MKKAKVKRQKVKVKREDAKRVFTSAFCLLPFAFLFGEQSVLNPAGPQSGRVNSLFRLMSYVNAAVFVLVGIAVLVAIFRKRAERKRKSDEPDISPDPQREQRMTRVVMGAVGVTIVILFIYLIGSYTTGRGLYSPAESKALSIKITGHQWWWDVEYDDPIASNIVHTANEIHIPVGQLVKLRLTSDDVIHSFWVPNLSGKKDLIPGHEIVLEFQSDSAGEFRGQCAEFCGYQHAKMALFVVAEPTSQYRQWAEASMAQAAPPSGPAAVRGQQVFMKSSCSLCHNIEGTLSGSHAGPDLTHLASRRTLGAGTIRNTRGNLAGWIVDPQRIKPGVHMPPNQLAPDDLEALLTYLQSLR